MQQKLDSLQALRWKNSRRPIGNSNVRSNFTININNKSITTAEKSISEMVISQSLVRNVVKCRKNAHYFYAKRWCKFPHVIQKYTNLANFARQYFVNKLCSFTNLRMFLLTVVVDFVFHV